MLSFSLISLIILEILSQHHKKWYCGFLLPVVFAYYEEWSEMVSDLREKAKEMMRGYEKACKEKKVI